ncbi:alpha/beta fold hydrolase [Ktedonobacter sp. SOSP1-85]|uniref:alpha/beta fold hydrolase n=1 Tax=Ktedonobacter sp. SOSP1-85 TaxID=2778367 RepID=UPI0019154012|nr:alpha/beta fold hydrolase [Ktedonobacter sp. SOSP1-85]
MAQSIHETNHNALTIREFQHKVQDINLFIRTIGESDADNVLIMAHGGPGLSHRYMLGLEQLAGPQLTVVNYDQRGTGQSVSPQKLDIDKFTPEIYAQDLEAVRQAVASEKKVHILGHSWGGMVAMQYALQYPEHIRSLQLINSVPPTVAGLQAGFQHFNARVQALQHKGIIPTKLSTDGLEKLQQILPVYVAPADPPLDLPALAATFDRTPEVGEKTWEALGAFDLREQVGKLQLPLQILFGEDDPFGRAWADETRDAFTEATIHFQVFSHCGHFGWLERPGAFLMRHKHSLIRTKWFSR